MNQGLAFIQPARSTLFRTRDSACDSGPAANVSPFYQNMIAPETFNHIENIKKRAGHLWRFL